MIDRSKVRVRINYDSRGSISTGTKDPKTGFPKSLDHFDVSDFKELVSLYGDKPDKLLVLMPSNEIGDFLEENYHRWGSNNQYYRSCTGNEETDDACFHRLPEAVDNVEYGAGEITKCLQCSTMPDKIEVGGKMKPNPLKCRYDMVLRCYVADPNTGKIDNPTPYRFTNHSRNSGDAVFFELDRVRTQITNGVLIGIPFILSVRMVARREDPKSKCPIWSMEIAIKSLGEYRQEHVLADSAHKVDLLGLKEPTKPVPEKTEPVKPQDDPTKQFPKDNEEIWSEVEARVKRDQAKQGNNGKMHARNPDLIIDKRHLAFIAWYHSREDRDGKELCLQLLNDCGYYAPEDVVDAAQRGEVMDYIIKQIALKQKGQKKK